MNSKQFNAKFDKLVDEFNEKISSSDIQQQISKDLLSRIDSSKDIYDFVASIADTIRIYNSEYSTELIRFILNAFFVDDD